MIGGTTLRKKFNALRNPHVIKRVVARRSLAFNSWFNDRFLLPDPVDIAAEEWDNLIILDGCRYDTFAEKVNMEGRLEKRFSPGSSTGEFLDSAFGGGMHHDTVYVTANPHLILVSDAFHRIVDLVHDPDYWDDEYKTVLPEDVVSATRDVHERYPNKRLIVHFMQPHYPFIGPTAEELEINTGIVGHIHKDPERETATGLWKEIAEHDPTNVWNELPKYGEETHELVAAAYRENLDIVLENVTDLINALDGKTVVTADHGNLLGERSFPIPVRGYGHPSGTHLPQLVTVPWFVVEGGKRRRTVAEKPVKMEGPDPKVVEERLRSLGYM